VTVALQLEASMQTDIAGAMATLHYYRRDLCSKRCEIGFPPVSFGHRLNQVDCGCIFPFSASQA
jgi:hypothetical protein